MSPASKIAQSSLPETDLRSSSEPPTTPGTYWFQSETTSRAIMLELRMTNGELMVWWPHRQDEPVAKLKGYCRGPIPPTTGPGSR
jgi:hypothetical protein